jgi:hypothetical protein
VGFDRQRPHQPQAALAIGEDAHDMGAMFNLFVQALQHEPALSATGKVRLMLAPGQRGERQMTRAAAPAIVRIIANTINEAARGDPDAPAARIVAALGEAGYRIVPANGIEDTALGSQPEKYEMAQLYRSQNGDVWFLARPNDRLGLRQAPSEWLYTKATAAVGSERLASRSGRSRRAA